MARSTSETPTFLETLSIYQSPIYTLSFDVCGTSEQFYVHEGALARAPGFLRFRRRASGQSGTNGRKLRLLSEDTNDLEEGRKKTRIIALVIHYLYTDTVLLDFESNESISRSFSDLTQTYLTACQYEVEGLRLHILTTFTDIDFCYNFSYRGYVFQMYVDLYRLTDGKDQILRDQVCKAIGDSFP
jgi:hypothetical protein